MYKYRISVIIVLIFTAFAIVSIASGAFIGNELSQRVVSESIVTPISYSQNIVIDSSFPIGKDYAVGGFEGSDTQIRKNLVLGDIKIQIGEENIHKSPISKYTFKGILSNDAFKAGLQEMLEKIVADLNTSNSEKYKNLIVENIIYNENASFNGTDQLLKIGSAEVYMENCNFINSLEIEYNINTKEYIQTNVSEFEDSLCSKYIVPESPFPTTCTDCFLYPVDKYHPLNSEYAVDVRAADAIPGGQRFATSAYEHLVDLYTAAKDAGHNMRITSAYRSYQDQQNVYESWVQYEMGFGKSRAQAESDANTYSALPGFSEHQLGTTADISSLDCIGIETVCSSNERFWTWLKDNAHKFGFVMSYPPGKDESTGYIHEPWHYRFIGLELAMEYKTKYDGRSYPAEFLRNKKLY